MPREIKFRAWDKVCDVMRDITSIDFEHSEVSMNPIKNDSIHDFSKMPGDEFAIKICRNINDVVIMQYTGIKDKNGREIFEGDIVKATIPFWENPRVRIAIVTWNDGLGCWDVCNYDKTEWFWLQDWLNRLGPEYLEVDGNIHEYSRMAKGE